MESIKIWNLLKNILLSYLIHGYEFNANHLYQLFEFHELVSGDDIKIQDNLEKY